jgi:hypothetical protein
MFCPECRAEYRPGFTRCADCDVDLVQELHAESSEAKAEHPTQDSFERFRTKFLLKSGLAFGLCFFLRPEGHWSGISGKGSYRVRLHHQKPCNRRVTHAVGGCKSGRACHAFHRAVVHRVPNNPLSVLLPDFVSHRNLRFSTPFFCSLATAL